MMRFSVIVPALNEEKFIEKCIKSLKNQDYKGQYEIIVVDSHSTDKTAEIAKRNAARVIYGKKNGPGSARNMGAAAAKGEILVFVDADSVVSQKHLSGLDKAFQDERVVAGTGPVLPLEKTNLLNRISFILVSRYLVQFLWKIRMPWMIGINMAFRKTAFEKAGCFNDKMVTCEDLELTEKIKKLGRFAFSKDSVVKTSLRRMRKWGYLRFVCFHIRNAFNYARHRKPSSEYEHVRN